MSVTTTLLKVLIAKLGDEASAKFILENNFLNKTEDDQIKMVAKLLETNTVSETGAIENEPDVIGLEIASILKELEVPEIDIEAENKFFEETEEIIEQMDRAAKERRIQTIRATQAKKHKRHSSPPRDKAQWYAFKKIFGNRYGRVR